MLYKFQQVDVFTSTPFGGNPVAVVLSADGLDTKEMQRLANWMNLSETTFVSSPRDPEADYRLRIFTPSMELPFAGHPTLGSCHAWLTSSKPAPKADFIVQECEAGLIHIRRTSEGLAFAAPPLVRSGPVEESLVRHIATLLEISRAEVVDSQWVDNGPGWVALLLESAEAVLDLHPASVDLNIGVVGPHPPGSPQDFEVRAFTVGPSGTVEDPVTGSLNASLAQWLLRTGRAPNPYVVTQGAALGRAGHVRISSDGDDVWVEGATVTRISGVVEL